MLYNTYGLKRNTERYFHCHVLFVETVYYSQYTVVYHVSYSCGRRSHLLYGSEYDFVYLDAGLDVFRNDHDSRLYAVKGYNYRIAFNHRNMLDYLYTLAGDQCGAKCA